MKMNKFILPLLLVLTFFMSCNEDNNLEPSNLERDWFVIQDNPNDPIQHAIYLFYEKTGIPVFYNDTIGQMERVDNWGNSYIHYTMLSINYALGGVGTSPSVYSYTLCPKEYVMDGLAFLETEIIPLLPETMSVRSFLLLNTLETSGLGSSSFKGLNTILVAQVPRLREMTREERVKLKAAVLRSIFTASISTYEKELESFYQTTRSYYTTEDLYGYNVWYYQNRTPYQDPEEVGFLGVDPSYTSCLPTESMDVSMYIEAMFMYSREEFEDLYGSYEAVMKKYDIMLSILESIGVSL